MSGKLGAGARCLAAGLLIGCMVATAEAQPGSATVSLVPIGVVGGNPPGTTISGNQITLTTTGVVVEMHLLIEWTGVLSTAQVKLDGVNGFASGSGADLNPFGWPATPGFGAYITTQRCFFSGREGCNTSPSNGIAPCNGADPNDGPCVAYSRYVFQEAAPIAVLGFPSLDYEFLNISQVVGGQTYNAGVPTNYAGTLKVEVPTGAAGTYTLDIISDPQFTFLVDENIENLTLTLVAGVIRIACQTNADCNDNDACTTDVCNQVTQSCESSPNYNPAVSCCDPADGTLTTIDDGNECTNDVCDPGTGDVAHDPVTPGTACGDPSDTECDNPDTCDAGGVCRSNVEPMGASCGDPTATQCNAADTCNGAGVCQSNILPAGSACGDPTDNDCTNPDTCDGAGVCLSNDSPSGLPCGNQVGNQCDNPDTCNGSGVCQPNFRPAGTACGNPADTQCDNPDSCNGAGVCSSNNEPNGTICADDGNPCRDDVCSAGICTHPVKPAGAACGSPTDTECDNPDACDGAGTCLANFEPTGAACGDPTSTDCNAADTCNGSGTCLTNVASAGTACGDPSDTDCDNPDTCNASGVCVANVAPAGLPCGNQVGNQCDNPDTCNGAGACQPNFVAAGTACGNPADTQCDNPDSCNGTGACAPNREPDGTMCADDGNPCRDDICLSGVCSHPLKPAGAACGDPTDSDCNDPDSCDGNGNCLINLVPAGTACGDPSDTICTDPDTCNASGQCAPNNAANGTSCDVGQFCLTDATCFSGVCAGGVPRNCSDGLPCTTDVCDEVNDVCVSTLDAGFCLIGGACYSDGQLNPSNDCEICDVFVSTSDWTFLSAGTPCNDGDPCTGTGEPGIGVDACDGAGLCFGTLDPNCNDDCINAVQVFDGANIGNNDNRGPDLVEASCQPDADNDVWYFYLSTCNGPVVVDTIGSSMLPDNDTVLSIWDGCPENGGVEIACDDDSGPGLESATDFVAVDGSTYYIRVAGYQDNTGDFALNITTIDGCVIDGICYLAGAVNPANECEECNPLFSSTDWSPSPAGTACGDPSDTQCDAPDACDGAGFCEANFKTDFTPCNDDGNDCTDDVCQAGVCAHPFKPVGATCGDPSDTECDDPDTCDGAGFCLDNFIPAGASCGDPTTSDCDNADICDGFGSCDPNFQPDGLACTDDGNDCTLDECSAGVCDHPAAPTGTACGDGSNTQCDKPDTCDGTGFCQANFEPTGTGCGDPSDTDCDNPDTCNGAGSCQTNYEPVDFLCGDPTDTDCDNPDSCDGVGTCLSNLEISGFPCGDPSNTQCDQPDTCDGGGVCLANFVATGTACGDPNSSECDNPDSCDGAGLCAVNHQPDGLSCTDDGSDCTADECLAGACDHPPLGAGTPCGDPSNTQCDQPDTCDGTGICLPNFASSGTACGDPTGTDCNNPDSCDGSGACAANLEPEGTACGDPTDTECDNPDTCDSGGVCLDNYEVGGFPCGDPSSTQCDQPDTCDGIGLCLDNFVAVGTPCGNPGTTQCDAADSCDGVGACDPNFLPDGTTCDDADVCTDNDGCSSGSCVGVPIPEAPLMAQNGPRSLYVTPQPAGAPSPVALRVTSPDWLCLDLYVQLDGTLGIGPVFLLPDDWATVSLVGALIVPDSTYFVEELCGTYTSPVGSATTCAWCDVDCNGVVNGNDILFQVNGFQGEFGLGVSKEALDVEPCTPNGLVNGTDILRCVRAFQFQETYDQIGCPLPCP